MVLTKLEGKCAGLWMLSKKISGDERLHLVVDNVSLKSVSIRGIESEWYKR